MRLTFPVRPEGARVPQGFAGKTSACPSTVWLFGPSNLPFKISNFISNALQKPLLSRSGHTVLGSGRAGLTCTSPPICSNHVWSLGPQTRLAAPCTVLASSPLLPSWTPPRAHCAGLRDQPAHWRSHVLSVILPIYTTLFLLSRFIIPTEFWNGPQVLDQALEGISVPLLSSLV